jgi:hypothetical protein
MRREGLKVLDSRPKMAPPLRRQTQISNPQGKPEIPPLQTAPTPFLPPSRHVASSATEQKSLLVASFGA